MALCFLILKSWFLSLLSLCVCVSAGSHSDDQLLSDRRQAAPRGPSRLWLRQGTWGDRQTMATLHQPISHLPKNVRRCCYYCILLLLLCLYKHHCVCVCVCVCAYTELSLKAVCVLLDSRRGVTEKDEAMLQMLSSNGIPFLVVLTKADKLSKREIQQSLTKTKQQIAACYPYYSGSPTIYLTSSKEAAGIQELAVALKRASEAI